MSKRLAGVLVSVAVLLALASGCTSSSERIGTQPGVTETVATQPTETVTPPARPMTAKRTGTFLYYITQDGVRTRENTAGMALVTLFDSGTAVGAICGIDGLEEGDKVSIQQFPHATWIVTGKL